MFSTLMRYDFKRLLKVILPLCGLIILSGGIVAFIFWRLSDPTDFEQYLTIPYGLLVFAAILTMIGGFVYCFVHIALSYQKNLMSDEGYLTFTLPVTQNQILLSKTISGSLCGLLAGLALVAAVFLLVMGVELTTTQALSNAGFEVTVDEAAGLTLRDQAPLLLASILSGIVDVISMVIRLSFAVTAGYCIAKNHKVLASIGFYLLVNFVSSIVTNFVMVIVQSSLTPVEESFSVAQTARIDAISLTVQSVLVLGIGVFLYFWTLKLLKTRLNLT